MNTSSRLLIPAALSLVFFATASAQDDEDFEPDRCVTVSRIDRTEVIDDRTIAFHLKGGDIYINRLDRACPRLDREGRFSYRVTTGQLCANDLITVLEQSGLGLRTGVSCGLGLFRPSDEEAVEMLKGNEEPAEVTIQEVEVEDDAADE